MNHQEYKSWVEQVFAANLAVLDQLFPGCENERDAACATEGAFKSRFDGTAKVRIIDNGVDYQDASANALYREWVQGEFSSDNEIVSWEIARIIN